VALPPASVLTPFVRYGDYVPWFSIGVVVIAILAAMPISRLVRRSRGS
jgi:hypothetical protein